MQSIFRQIGFMKLLLGFLAVFLVIFSVSCGDSTESSDDSRVQEVLSDPEDVRYVLKLSATLDSDAKKLTWTQEQVTCGVENLANVQSVEKNLRYAFQGSDLLLWESGHCNAEVLQGGPAGEVRGTWIYAGAVSSVPEEELPASGTCVGGPAYRTVLDHEGDTLKIGESSVTWIQHRSSFCPAVSDSARLAISFFNEADEILPEGCAKTEIISEERTGILTYLEYDRETMGVKRTFAFEADTCVWDETAEITDEYCQANPGGAYANFEACVKASGLFGQE